MSRINALLIFVPGLFKYNQRQSLKGSSSNPGLSAFQSKCLDYYKLFVSLPKNVLRAQSPKSKKLLQRENVYVFLHMFSSALQLEKILRFRKNTRKHFRTSNNLSLGYMARESSRVPVAQF